MLKNLLLKLKSILVFDEDRVNNEYLNQAKDIQDLEYRMKQLDKEKNKNKHLYYYS